MQEELIKQINQYCPSGHLPAWKHVQLSKIERKGKTPKEIETLRIQKWEQQCKEQFERGEVPDDKFLAFRLV